MNAPVEVREMTKADFDFVVSVIDRWWGGPSSDRALPVFFHELGRHALVATQQSAVVGFLFGFLSPLATPVGYVHLVGIDPEARRRGVGKRLYEAFIGRMSKEGARRVKAITPVGNDGSIAFHEALGFLAHEIADYGGPGRPRVVMTKDL